MFPRISNKKILNTGGYWLFGNSGARQIAEMPTANTQDQVPEAPPHAPKWRQNLLYFTEGIPNGVSFVVVSNWRRRQYDEDDINREAVTNRQSATITH